MALVVNSAVSPKVKKRFLIIAPFAFLPIQEISGLPKEANFDLWLPPDNSHLSLWFRTRKLTAIKPSKICIDCTGSFILVTFALHLYIQSLNTSFLRFAIINQMQEWHDRERAEFASEKLGHRKLGEFCAGQNHRKTSIVTNPTDIWRLDYPTCNALRYINSGIVFSGQSKAKGGQKNHKGIHGVRIREWMVREERRNEKKYFWSDIKGGSSLSWCWPLLFLVNLILGTLAFAQDHMWGGTFFSCEICTQCSTPYKLAVARVPRVWFFLWLSLLQKHQSKIKTVCK